MKLNTQHIKIESMAYSDIANLLSHREIGNLIEAKHKTKKGKPVRQQEETGAYID